MTWFDPVEKGELSEDAEEARAAFVETRKWAIKGAPNDAVLEELAAQAVIHYNALVRMSRGG